MTGPAETTSPSKLVHQHGKGNVFFSQKQSTFSKAMQSLELMTYFLAILSVGRARYRCNWYWFIALPCSQCTNPPITNTHIVWRVKGFRSQLTTYHTKILLQQETSIKTPLVWCSWGFRRIRPLLKLQLHMKMAAFWLVPPCSLVQVY
jgi:hypothetical protein